MKYICSQILVEESWKYLLVDNLCQINNIYNFYLFLNFQNLKTESWDFNDFFKNCYLSKKIEL